MAFFCNAGHQVRIAWQNEGWAQKMKPEQCKKFKAAACTAAAAEAAQEKVKTKEHVRSWKAYSTGYEVSSYGW